MFGQNLQNVVAQATKPISGTSNQMKGVMGIQDPTQNDEKKEMDLLTQINSKLDMLLQLMQKDQTSDMTENTPTPPGGMM